jgi:CheY-like chemotaxis protein
LKGVKVLLVEDYPVNVKVATKFLSRWEIDFDVAENGLVAVEKYKMELRCHFDGLVDA